MSRKNMTGSHVNAKSDTPFATPAAIIPSPIGRSGPRLKRRDDLVDRREPNAFLPPRGHAPHCALGFQAARGLLDKDHPPAAGEEAADRGVVADVGGDAEDDHLLRVEQLEQAAGIRVREDVEALRQEQELPAAEE